LSFQDTGSPGGEIAAETPSDVEDQAGTEDANTEAEAPTGGEDEFEEIEYSGKKYNVPKELKPGFMFQADYTQKTQQFAESRREMEARQQVLDQHAQMAGQYAREMGQLAILDEEIQKWDKFDWNAKWREDPTTAAKWSHDLQRLKDRRGNLAQSVSGLHQQNVARQQQAFTERVNKAKEAIQKEIKGWNSDLDNKLFHFAQEQGLQPHELQMLATDVRLVKVLHKAYVADQAAKAAAKSKGTDSAVKPTITVSKRSSAPPTGLSDNLSMSEWIKRRNEQEKRKA
jgi:hypothetical protein